MKKKLLLLHGWNWRNYTKLASSDDVWANRKQFVDKLSKKYDVYKLTFPGFCNAPEPNKPWNLNDYAKYVKDYLEKMNLKPDYILGYSFGGAVATRYNTIYDNDQSIILVSPAITRNKTKSKTMPKTPKILNPIRNKLRDLYLILVVKNNYMINGTKFLNSSYQNIVRVELLDELNKINPNKLTIIYGDKDTEVNPKYIIKNIDKKHKNCISIIKDGTHDIANSNTDELINIINKKTKLMK